MAGAAVAFAVTAGNGVTSPRVAITDAAGQASATWTLGTIAGPNQVTASVMGVAAWTGRGLSNGSPLSAMASASSSESSKDGRW